MNDIKNQSTFLFRENAIKSLNSSDEIDVSFEVIRVSGWIWIVSAVVFLIGIGTWFFFGKISVNVTTDGVLIPEKQLKETEQWINEKSKVTHEKLMLLKNLLNKKIQLYEHHYLTLSDLKKAEEEYILAEGESRHMMRLGEGNFKEMPNNEDDFYQELSALLFVKKNEAKKILKGMKVYVLPTLFSSHEYGYIQGEVESISNYPINKELAYSYLDNQNLVDEFFESGVPFLVKIHLKKDLTSISQFAWTYAKGPPFKISAGTMVQAKIVEKECSPFEFLMIRN